VLRIDLRNGSRETGLDGGDAGEVGQVACVVCSGRGGEYRLKEGEVFGVDGEGIGVQCLVDFLSGCEAGRAWRPSGSRGQ
jgi:hypothetical protein